MTLTNYWFVIIWVFAGGFFCFSILPKRKEVVLGKLVKRNSPIATYIFITPLIIWAGYRKNFGDTEQYRKTFHEMAGSLSEFSTFFMSLKKDRFFYSLEYIFKNLFGDKDVLFFLLLALIQILIISNMYRKYSVDYWLSMFIFVASADYFSWVFNGTRQFLAVTIIYASTRFILKRQYIIAVLLILLAAQFHGSAYLMLPVIFIVQGRAFNRRTLICLLLSVLAIVFIDRFTSLLDTLLSETQYTNVVSDWQSWQDDGMNPLRALVYSIPTLAAIIGLRQIRTVNNPLVNIAANASLITTAFSIVAVGTSGIFIGRLPIYTSLYANGILLPWIIENVFEKSSIMAMKFITVFAYLLFFYYQMHFSWGMI